jgi:hypothetical protein
MNLRSTQTIVIASQHMEKLRVRVKAIKAQRIIHIPSNPYFVSDDNSTSDSVAKFAQDLIFTQLTPWRLPLSCLQRRI